MRCPKIRQFHPMSPLGCAIRRTPPGDTGHSNPLNLRSNTDQTTWNGKVEVVLFCEERDDPAEDGLAFCPSLAVLDHDARPDLNLLAHLEDTRENRSTGDTALQLVNFGTWLVDVEGSDDDESRGRREVSDRNGDVLDNVLCHRVDVVPQLGRDGDDRRVAGDGTCEEGTAISISGL